jgi:hypothetical protein
MDRAVAKVLPSEELLFQDGLGDRLLVRDTHGRAVHESLLLRSELVSVPSFEFALSQRVALLETFNHSSFVRIRKMVRVAGPLPRLSLLSDYSGGVRLSDMLSGLDTGGKTLPTSAALFLIKEILDGVAVLHRHKAVISHGALAPERIVIGGGRVRITDFVLGSAIEQLRFSPERYWKELRVAVPPSAGGARLDRRVDVAQIAMIAVALFAGRPLRDSEHIGALTHLLPTLAPAPALRGWLERSLHMDPRRVFVNATEASQALNAAMSEAGLRPSAADLGSLKVKRKQIQAPITIKTTQPPPLPAPPVVHSSVESDPWAIEAGTMFTGAPLEERPFEPAGFLRRRRGPKLLVKLGIYGAIVAATFTAAQYIPAPAALFSRSGTLVVESRPAGIELRLDGQPQGVTPITLKVKSGRHEVELRGPGKPKTFNVFISSGARVSQYIEFPTTRTRR